MTEIIIDATIRAGTPLLYATLGEILMEKSGIINLGVEGVMLIGALSGFYVSYSTGNLFLGVVVAFILSALAGLFHGIFSTYFKGNQIVSGLAMTMFGVGITAVMGKKLVGVTIEGFQRIKIPFFSEIPVLGSTIFNQDVLVYLSILVSILLGLFTFKTIYGLKLRTVGENPYAADVSGINVYKYKIFACFLGSGLVGVGGAYLSLAYTPMWVENMSAGRGWIAVALVIFSSWSYGKAILGAYFFGGVSAMQPRFQAMGVLVPAHVLQMLPYIFTIIVLVFVAFKDQNRTSKQPESLGMFYDREDRK